MKRPNRALFLDRDGVVNREIGYLYRPEQVHFVPGIFELCRSAQALRYRLIIITNQAGIARQIYTEEQFHRLMQWMSGQFANEGIVLDGYYFCPHHPESAMEKYRRDCFSRKPNPGMLLQAARDHQVDLGESLLIGDRYTDMQAGLAAGVGAVCLLAGTELTAYNGEPRWVHLASLHDALEFIQKTNDQSSANG
jgi:D-glycero-D-manno-heptose 1,7-bisphosphate phosphatase